MNTFLEIGVAVECRHPELAAEARLFHAAEGSVDTHGTVRVDREDAGFMLRRATRSALSRVQIEPERP